MMVKMNFCEFIRYIHFKKWDSISCNALGLFYLSFESIHMIRKIEFDDRT